jgi:ribosomal protein S19
MEKAPKIYAGSGKTKGEGWLQVSVNPEILSQHVQEYNGKKYVKLNINIGKEDKFGKDVQITIDTWKPTPKANSFTSSNDDSGLPF